MGYSLSGQTQDQISSALSFANSFGGIDKSTQAPINWTMIALIAAISIVLIFVLLRL